MKLEPIDTSTTAGKARVMQLAAEGRRVAINGISADWRFWKEAELPGWDWANYVYAIIAQPVGPDEVWVTVVDGKTAMDVFETEEQAAAGLNRGWEAVRYRRVEE